MISAGTSSRMRIDGAGRTVVVTAAVVVGCLLAGATSAAEFQRRNPYLADSVNPMAHGDPAQQDAVPVAGPADPGPRLSADEVQYTSTGPAHFGAFTSSPYPDGRRVNWSNGLDRVVKVDFETFEVLATYWLPGARRWTEAEAEDAIDSFDASNEGIGAIWRAFRESQKLRDLSGVYTLLDKDNTYYVARKDGSITAYTDADPSDPASEIVVKGTFELPSVPRPHPLLRLRHQRVELVIMRRCSRGSIPMRKASPASAPGPTPNMARPFVMWSSCTIRSASAKGWW